LDKISQKKVQLYGLHGVISQKKLQLYGLHGVISQKKILFKTTAVKTSNPTKYALHVSAL
jgi:hypothetical protein